MNRIDRKRKSLEMEVLSKERARVYFLGPPPELDCAPLLRYFDQAGICVVSDVDGLDADTNRLQRIISDCSGLISVFSAERLNVSQDDWFDLLSLCDEKANLPHLVVCISGISCDVQFQDDESEVSINEVLKFVVPRQCLHGPLIFEQNNSGLDAVADVNVDKFIAQVCTEPCVPSFAFLIGRLERDFEHAREAIRAAVECNAGIPCLWADDGRHRLDTPSVRQSTQLLLEHAALVIADLSLGPENPHKENPSRAHEIGLSIAFGRPLMLSSKEPRRYPYFSIGDLQMFFWADERDLYERVCEWLQREQGTVGRSVLNYRLCQWDQHYQAVIRPATFKFDTARRYRWSYTGAFNNFEQVVMAASIGALTLVAALSMHLDSRLGWVVYAIAGLVGGGSFFVLSRWRSKSHTSVGRAARNLPVILVLFVVVLTVTIFYERF